jgi:hypothetical protein
MRVAFPLASGFVVWVLGLSGSFLLLKHSRRYRRRSRPAMALVAGMTAVLAAWFSLNFDSGSIGTGGLMPVLNAEPAPDPANDPIGISRGVNPSRVVWVHDPDATDWEGPSSGESCWEPPHTDQLVVEDMLSKAIRWLAGRPTEAEAWDALFRYTNLQNGLGDRGYGAGEKIVVKLNLTACYTSAQPNPASRQMTRHLDKAPVTSPQLTLALLKQLIDVVGVEQADIAVGDPVTFFPQQWRDYITPHFPEIVFLDHYPFEGHTPVQFSTVELHWSTNDAAGTLQDYLPQSYADADYLINVPVLKSHAGTGITISAKNHFGSMIRSPVGSLWGATENFYDLHANMPSELTGRGHYRALVDLMGHHQIGGKTVLYLVDALFCGQLWYGMPSKWNMSPFEGDWPSSIFASQDPVAIDSVGYDFLLAEWPADVGIGDGGAQDYLHEAALADNPPSGAFYDPENDGTPMGSLGVHEHWNNSTDKQYSRNLCSGQGIELVSFDPLTCLNDSDSDDDMDGTDLYLATIDTAGVNLCRFATEFGRSDCL